MTHPGDGCELAIAIIETYRGSNGFCRPFRLNRCLSYRYACRPLDLRNAPFKSATHRTTNKFNSLMASHIALPGPVRILAESKQWRGLPVREVCAKDLYLELNEHA
jgi:hypothetical protein